MGAGAEHRRLGSIVHLRAEPGDSGLESFGQVAKVFYEGRGYVVTSNVKFPVLKQTKRAAYAEFQEHGYEIDLVAARAQSLVLASVKSYLSSTGVQPQGFKGLADESKTTHFNRYTIFNDPYVRKQVVAKAAERYGYPVNQVQLALCVGKFAYKHGSGEARIRQHLGRMEVGAGPVHVFNLEEIVDGVLQASRASTYHDDPVIMTVKALTVSGRL